MRFIKSSLAIALATLAIAAQAGPVITNTVNATTLASTIAGTGITISNASLTYAGTTLLASPTGTFTGGTPSVGFDSGIVLTNGTTACATGTNTASNCGLDRGGNLGNGVFDKTTLAFDFTSGTGAVFFQYVFASEEYNEFVNGGVNDTFELLLNGANIALLPGNTIVSIDTVNCGANSGFYRNNSSPSTTACPNLNLSIQYDGLTTILTASGTVGTGINNFAFSIFDRGDGILDSGVFVKAGSFSGTNQVPEPGSLALVGAALFGLAVARRRKT